MPRIKSLSGWSLLALVLVGAAYWGWQRPAREDGGKARPQDKPPVPVLVARAETRDMPVVLDLVGRAQAYENVTLKARVDGQVMTVAYTEGQHV